ncbi:MAG: hypothetical protein MUO43_09135 [Desulfobacterales bacterium]|nr:hypothetical protein [Desulfobacterales bacterium]
MKKFWSVNLAFMVVFLFSVGCETTKNIKSTITSVGSPAYQELFSQVPEDMKDDIYKAEFDMKVSSEKLKLAKLKNKITANQEKYSDEEVDLAENYYEQAEITLEIQKVEAIIKSNLGKKEDNINSLANLKSKKLRTEADRIKIEAGLENSKLAINDLLKQIKDQEEMIKEMDMGKVEVEESAEDITTEPVETGNKEQES